MKRSQISTLLILVAVSTLALGVAAGWLTAQLLAMTGGGVLFWGGTLLVLLVVAGALFAAHTFARAFLRDVRQLVDAGRLVLTANPAYRVAPHGHSDVKELAVVFNQFADRFAEVQEAHEAAIRRANASLAEERTLLATLMAELTEGVLVCNLDGQLLLYNRSAYRQLDTGAQEGARAFVGLGRSVFGVIDRNTIMHALDQVRHRHRRREGDDRTIMTSFVTTAANGRLLRTRLAPVADSDGELRGYVLTLQDISEGFERSRRRDALLQHLTERLRAAVGSIRAASEALETFPEMATAQRNRFEQVIREEATALSRHIDEAMRAYASDLRAQWQLEEMAASDLLMAIQYYLAGRHTMNATLEEVDAALWLKVDSYTLVQGISHLAGLLAAEFGLAQLTLALTPAERFAALDIGWAASAAPAAAWQAWKTRALTTDDSDGVITLSEAAERHGGEVWFQLHSGGDRAHFRLLLPRATATPQSTFMAAAPGATTLVESRPEYYDFDLFHQPGQRPDLDERPLRALTCTVFDTETTGLTPGLDEIISIGALRLVNGRLLRQEVYEQLLDPQRPISAASTDIHGITDAMVADQPTIDDVLPHFHAFVEDTVLVGHNLAFDMRMLQEKEQASGVCFVNPILDTLLLSALIHPEEDRHSLEAIAQRLGVQALGRHTALGDAIVTGEIFLRMIPLLERQGIVTLRQARDAAQRTYLARLAY